MTSPIILRTSLTTRTTTLSVFPPEVVSLTAMSPSKPATAPRLPPLEVIVLPPLRMTLE